MAFLGTAQPLRTCKHSREHMSARLQTSRSGPKRPLIPIHAALLNASLLRRPLFHQSLVLRPPRLIHLVLPRHLHQRPIGQLLAVHLHERKRAILLHADQYRAARSTILAKRALQLRLAQIDLGIAAQLVQPADEELFGMDGAVEVDSGDAVEVVGHGPLPSPPHAVHHPVLGIAVIVRAGELEEQGSLSLREGRSVFESRAVLSLNEDVEPLLVDLHDERAGLHAVHHWEGR
mmetsp:Transcript_11757/g.25268  ORF Transcript_11757/g.25268 Transcript_11757/m.25268 type:complete len:233 (-) Transcript_11757:1269-1967(-)